MGLEYDIVLLKCAILLFDCHFNLKVKFPIFKGCFNTPLEHTPKPLPKG